MHVQFMSQFFYSRTCLSDVDQNAVSTELKSVRYSYTKKLKKLQD